MGTNQLRLLQPLDLSPEHQIELIGSKQAQASFIVDSIKSGAPRARRVADVFSGTGAISRALKASGYEVVANDQLRWCSILAEAILLNNHPPRFRSLGEAFSSAPDPYIRVLEHLNALPPEEGFFYREYSPATRKRLGYSRMYFTEMNAGRIDAIRKRIGSWDTQLRPAERALLLADLIRAADAVSNVAGTYGCYLKNWKPRALRPLELTRSTIVFAPTRPHEIYCDDANTLVTDLHVDVVYADPPYTKRQYAAYYHILETIARGDSPNLIGSTGLRPWRELASPYCYRRHALRAFAAFVDGVRAKHLFLSYNDDGQMGHTEILGVLRRKGEVNFTESSVRRYRSSQRRHKGPLVTERLYHLRFAN